jgi:hypothetical protein
MAEDKDNEISTREFVKGAAAVTASAMVLPAFAMAAGRGREGASGTQPSSSDQVPKRPLGKTGAQVSCLGVGGYHLGSAKGQQESNEIVTRALDAGINFFDNAWDYRNGESEERLGIALKGKRDRAFLMTKVCTHGRDKDAGMQMLEQSLRRLQTDHLDL